MSVLMKSVIRNCHLRLNFMCCYEGTKAPKIEVFGFRMQRKTFIYVFFCHMVSLIPFLKLKLQKPFPNAHPTLAAGTRIQLVIFDLNRVHDLH